MTIVVDASAVAELLLGTSVGLRVGEAVETADLVAPDHVTAEVLSVLRGWTLGGHVSAERALATIGEFRDLGIRLVPAGELMEAAFDLRDNVSAYDALYVALARALGCPLLTLDRRLAAAAPDVALVLPQSQD